MNGLLSLFQYILIGEFGLLTMMPRYLFCVLFPVMCFLGFFSSLLGRLPCLQGARKSFFYGLAGLGCTTAALAASVSIRDKNEYHRMIWILVLLIPCSSQLAMIAAFASMVSLRVFIAYLLFSGVAIAVMLCLLRKGFPQPFAPVSPPPPSHNSIHPLHICREAFLSVTSTIPSFSSGSVILSVFTYLGCMEKLSNAFAPWLNSLLCLPQEAMNLFIVNLFKRDLGSAALLSLAENGAFDAMQMVTVMIMLTFCTPCFNSTILLLKHEKLPMTILLWLGSLCVSLLLGFMVCQILMKCTF